MATYSDSDVGFVTLELEAAPEPEVPTTPPAYSSSTIGYVTLDLEERNEGTEGENSIIGFASFNLLSSEDPEPADLKLYAWNGSFIQSCKIRTWSGTDWV